MDELPFNQIMGGYGSKLFQVQQAINNAESLQIELVLYEGSKKFITKLVEELSKIRKQELSMVV